jgi:hypothetical protein
MNGLDYTLFLQLCFYNWENPLSNPAFMFVGCANVFICTPIRRAIVFEMRFKVIEQVIL